MIVWSFILYSIFFLNVINDVASQQTVEAPGSTPGKGKMDLRRDDNVTEVIIWARNTKIISTIYQSESTLKYALRLTSIRFDGPLTR